MGYTIDMEFNRNLVDQGAQLKTVVISSFDFQSKLSSLSSMLPSTITTLKLKNGELTSFDLDIQTSFPALVYLYVKNLLLLIIVALD